MLCTLLCLGACANSPSSQSSEQTRTEPAAVQESSDISPPTEAESSFEASRAEKEPESQQATQETEPVEAVQSQTAPPASSEPTPAPTEEQHEVHQTSNPTPANYAGEDFLYYEGLVWLNITYTDWIETYTIGKGELLGKIKRSGVSESFVDWDATVLPVGTKIYHETEHYYQFVLAEVDGELIPYMKMVEG